MQIDNKNPEDLNLDSFSNDDIDFENFFKDSNDSEDLPQVPEKTIPEPETTPAAKAAPKTEEIKPAIKSNDDAAREDANHRTKETETAGRKKRTMSDFEPDMDALLMTAQSSMIIEGMQYHNNKNYSSETLQVYIEAFKGIDLYIKILNRNPNNYRKLKTLIDSDIDCQQVEKIAFELYKKEYKTTPDSDREKLEAFELFKQIFKQAVNKSSISKSMKIIRKYFLLSGGPDLEKIQDSIRNNNIEIKRDLNHFHQHLKVALEMVKKGDSEIAKGLRGRDLNVFITKASELLGFYYKMHDNIKISDYYYRIHNIYKKYYIVK